MASNSSSVLSDAVVWYHSALSKGDSRVKDWPLMNPVHMMATVTGYLVLLFVLVKWMQTREKPFKLKWVAVVHNLFLTLLSAYMMTDILTQAILGKYSLFGNAVDPSDKGLPMARALWIFYVSKVAEFGDTFIMALKQNYHQITFLHVYHHSSIFVIWWVVLFYAPGGEGYFSASLNSFIHVLMYSYYLWVTLSGSKPRGPKPVWTEPAYYKRSITTMQMVQFCIMLVQAAYDLLIPNPYPSFPIWILFFYMISMLTLFGNFYLHAYLSKGKSSKSEGEESHKPRPKTKSGEGDKAKTKTKSVEGDKAKTKSKLKTAANGVGKPKEKKQATSNADSKADSKVDSKAKPKAKPKLKTKKA